MSGLGTETLGVWPLGFTTFPDRKIIGLIRVAGAEPIAATRAAGPEPVALMRVQPPEPIGILRSYQEPIILSREAVP